MRNMTDNEILLRQAADEIRLLRRRVEIAEAKAMVVETFHAALFGQRDQGMAVDIVWSIERYLAQQQDTQAPHVTP